MTRYIIFLLAFFTLPCAAQSGWGAIGGIGQGMESIGRSLLDAELQRQMLQQQHDLEMQRIEREHEMRLEEMRRQEDVRRRAAEEARGPERQKVDKAHPGWVGLVRTEDFRGWLSAQPESVKARARSSHAEDAILVLDLYKRDRIKP